MESNLIEKHSIQKSNCVAPCVRILYGDFLLRRPYASRQYR